MLFLCFSCNNWWILSKFGHKTCQEEVVTSMDKPMEVPIEWKWFIPHLRENILILPVLFVRSTKVSTYLRYLLYTTKVCGFILFFFWLVLDRKRSQRTARLVVACKASPIKSLCKIKSYALKKAIIFRSTRVATQSHNFCGSFEKQSANCRTERTPATPSYVNAKEEII